MSQRIVCIIQARMGSTRLPGKVLLPIIGKPLLLRVLDRVLESKLVDHIIVATTIKTADARIAQIVEGYNPKISIFRGSEEDVLDRYYKAAQEAKADIVIRVTSDNPMVDPDVIDRVVQEFFDDQNLEYVSNNIGKHTFPRGLDVEGITFRTLEKLWQTTTEPIDREHVTIHIKRFPEQFKWKSIENSEDLSMYRWTVDEESDFKLVNILYERLLATNPHFRMNDVIDLFKRDPELFKINASVEQKNAKY